MRKQTKKMVAFAALLAAFFSCAAFFGGCDMLSETFASAAPTASPSSLVISEIVSSNKRSLVDETAGTPDWIEFYNAGSAALDLSGYGVSDNMRELHQYVFPEGTVLEAGEYLLLYAADAGVSGARAACAGFGLSKSGDYLFVTDAYYGLIVQMEIPALYTDVSYARAMDGSYGYCASTTPGAANSGEVYASLAALFAAQNLGALSLSEVMPNADAGGYKWVELKNNGASAMRLENFCLSDDDAKPLKWQFPTASIPAGGYVCVYLSGLGSEGKDGIHAAFRLGSEDNYLTLSDLQGNVIDRLEWQSGVPAGVAIVRDASGAAVYTAFPTFEAENSIDTFTSLNMTAMDAGDPIHISEALRDNTLSAVDADGDRSEWVELRNFSGEALSLHGYFLSDDGDDLYKWALPDVTIDAGGYLIVYLSGKDRSQGELHASFRLSAEENEVFLTSLDGMRTEALSLAGVRKENVSVGLDDRLNIRYYAMPTPGYQNAQGFETADEIGCFDQNGIFISEVSAVQEIKSGENDWIELHNGSGGAVDLTGWHLSDDPDEREKFRLEGVTIAAGGYVVIEATSHATRQKGGVAPFGISPAGETLVLTNAVGELTDSFDTGALAPDVTSGRVETDPSIARVFFATATRGKQNSSDVSAGVSPQPVFSVTNLYHTQAFSVAITCDDSNAAIYYTTDGDEPTYRAKQYTGPVTISGSTPLRAISYAPGKRTSAITTATYLFGEPHTVPVICITGNAKRINEVMRVDNQRDKVERLATISFYETDGTFGTEFPAGIKPKGAGTVAYAQKSLSLNLRGGYGQSSVTYPFWPGYEFTTFSALVVRNSGQDMGSARIRDAYVSALVEGMYVDNSATRPVVVYINGAYNGLYDLGEDQNAEFLETHYGIDGDTVDFIRRNSAVIKGGNADIKRVRQYGLNKNLADDDVFAEFCEWIDVQYFTDYFIAQTYICNSDMFNQKYWRTQDYGVKWRPVFYDLDFGFKNGASRDIIGQYFNVNGVPSADKSLTYFEIYIGLKKNASWREYCVERYVEVVETYFNSERALALFDEMVSAMRPEMPRQINKWGRPSSMHEWESAIASMRGIIEQRPAYALENMRRYFGVSKEKLNELVAKYSTSG